MYHMSDWWGPGFGWIFMILFWVLVILAIVALAKWLSSTRDVGSARRPLDILQERYARGEITRDQYEQMRRDLEA
jgi:putative membrane protein